jgi:predicted chitinase/ribosomal protein S18 acetylase RimI-like enzyme
MRATEFITELFQPGKKNWEWARLGRDEASAFFKIGDREYLWQAFVGRGNPKKWEIQFRLIRKPDVDPDELDLFGTTGTGNSAEVMSTAVDITRAFLKEYGLDNVEEITFNAKEDSRIGLYAKMIKRLLPNWDLYSKKDPYDGMVFTLTDRRAYDKPENKLSEDKRIARYNGLIMGYAFNNTGLKIKAYDPVTRTPVAFAEFVKEDKELYPQMLWVHDDYRNKGIAKSMYDFLKDDGYEINRSHDQTNAGAKFWDKHRGEDAYVWEDMTRRGFLGGLAGMAAAPAMAKQMPAREEPPNLLSNNPANETTMLKTAKKSGMKGPELAQFMAQTKHESWDFERLKEKPQPGVKDYYNKKYDIRYSPKTAKILGNKRPGDGERYHGRGFIQLTGRDNYRMAGQALGIDLLNHPELASKPDIAAQIAVWYWNTRVKPGIQNFADTHAVTRKINPAAKGLENRHENFKDYMRII